MIEFLSRPNPSYWKHRRWVGGTRVQGASNVRSNPDENVEAVDDDDEEEEDDLPTGMGWQCLHNYSGEHVIIHIGETFLDANYGMDQARWGRSSAPEFQQRLASAEFHCILKVELPNWLHTPGIRSVSGNVRRYPPLSFAAEDEEEEEEEYKFLAANGCQ